MSLEYCRSIAVVSDDPFFDSEP